MKRKCDKTRSKKERNRKSIWNNNDWEFLPNSCQISNYLKFIELWSWTVLWRPTRPSRTNTQKRCPFHQGDWNAKVRSQEIPAVPGKFGLGVQNKAGQRLTEFCPENALIIANTLSQQHKTLHMDITRWSTPKSGWLYSLQPKMEKLYTVSKNKTRAGCGSDHELLIAKFRLKWKKVGKTTRPFK